MSSVPPRAPDSWGEEEWDLLGDLSPLGGLPPLEAMLAADALRPRKEQRTAQRLLDGLAEGVLPAHLPGDRLQATTACKAAVKKGDRLQLDEMQKLLDDWRATPQPLTCPHGCPVAVEVGYQELLRRFKRI